MQKLFLFCVIFLAAANLPAQETNPFHFPLEIGNKWFLRGDDPGVYDMVISYTIVDTVRIGPLLYFDINPGLFEQDGLYRIDSLNNFIEMGNGIETILCNFSMAPGDSVLMRIDPDTSDSAFCYCRDRELKPSLLGEEKTEISYVQNWSQIYTDYVAYLHVTDGIGLAALGKVWYDNPYKLIGAVINGHFYGDSMATAIQQKKDVPSKWDLQNHPNPFNSQTTITFALDRPAFVELNIFDITGRRVKTLLDRALPAGRHSVIWDAATAPSGVYLCQLRAGEKSLLRKIVVQK